MSEVQRIRIGDCVYVHAHDYEAEKETAERLAALWVEGEKRIEELEAAQDEWASFGQREATRADQLQRVIAEAQKEFEGKAITAAYADNERAERIWGEVAQYFRTKLSELSSEQEREARREVIEIEAEADAASEQGEQCPECKGEGEKEMFPDEYALTFGRPPMSICPRCKGTGQVDEDSPLEDLATRTEYRAIGRYSEAPVPPTTSLEAAREAASYFPRGNVRIQSRTVTETPWTDIEEKDQ